MNDSDEKQAILSRVREALQQGTDPHVRERSLSPGHELPIIENAGDLLARRTEFLPPVGSNFDEQVALFAEISERLKTEFHRVDSMGAATDIVQQLAADNQWKSIGYHQNELVAAVTEGLTLEKLSTDTPLDAHDLERCDAGISACEALIAQTASVLVTAKSSGGRALSVLPPHHVVIASRTQLLGSMVDGYRLLHENYGPDRWPSFFSFITGPSRTADVERVLVLGAHGPKRLTVILVG